MEKIRYSKEELVEFEELITANLDKAKKELASLKKMLNKSSDDQAVSTGDYGSLDYSADNAERENMTQLAARQSKFVQNLERALMRINNGTYGVCAVTGKLIAKERLRLVPHTTESIEAKRMRE